ncbi:hypothetical protein ACES2L_14435 [Bdellovibrio bacteriovorus]
MKTNSFLKITLIFISHALIALAMVSCTFKKDYGTSKKSDVQVQVASIDGDTLANIFLEKEESEIIDKLSADFGAYEQAAIKLGKTLVHYSIKNQKKLVLQFLLVKKQLSPFKIGSEAYEVLSYNSALEEVVTATQNEIFLDILRNPSKLKEQISIHDFGIYGCQKFANKILEFKYQNIYKIKRTSPFFDFLDKVDFDAIFRKTLTETECSSHVNKFSTADVSSWLGKEFLFQFHRDFSSIEFFKFLWFLGSSDEQPKLKSFRLEIPLFDRELVDELGVNYVNISPETALWIKSPCQPERASIAGTMENKLSLEWEELIKESRDCLWCDPRTQVEAIKDLDLIFRILLPNSHLADEDVLFSVLYGFYHDDSHLPKYKSKVCTVEHGGQK